LNFFFDNPTRRVRLRELERELNLPLPSVIRYVKQYVKEGYLKQVKISNVIFYSADRSSKQFILEKRLNNIRRIYSSEFVEFLIDELSNPIIILFGSFFKGEDTEESDIDIFIQTASSKKPDLNQFEKLLKHRIQVFLSKNIKDIRNTDLMNNIVNGFTLNGVLEVF
jgi:predicted nucleotidyltransferase